jgi:hypothetical protein
VLGCAGLGLAGLGRLSWTVVVGEIQFDIVLFTIEEHILLNSL